jgi:DNA-binding GntR family transcriptional regulator
MPGPVTPAPLPGGRTAAGHATGDLAIALTGLADEIALRIERAIVDGAYPPGSRLPQDELCARFGVSRTPIREALRKLQARNLVVVAPNRGATVRIPTRKELMDIYDVRAELEGYAAELAAARMTDQTVTWLDRAQADLERLMGGQRDDQLPHPDAGSPLAVALNQANDEFHRVIMDAAGNERLYAITRDLGRMFPKDYVWRAIQDATEMRALNVAEHRRIRDAVATGDGAAARSRMRDHIRHARTVLLRHLDQLGFWQ